MPTLPTQAEPIQTDGTHLQGQLRTKYQRLVNCLGRPGEGPDGTPEWRVQIGAVVATVYLHKFRGDATQAELWNVGGFDGQAVELVRRLVMRPTWHLPPTSHECPKLRRLIPNGDRLAQWSEWS